MPAITYKCFNCGGQLEFKPALQKLQCVYCRSVFTEDEIARLSRAEAERRAAVAAAERGEVKPEDQKLDANLYHCPTCGAEIVTDDTTAATSCYYCHNPVVLTGRLSGGYLPQYVIPFAVEREKAVHTFLDWVRSKKFVPKNFFSPDQIARVSGVYFPYWMVDSDANATMDGRATRVRVWRSGDTEYTETSHYNIMRQGDVRINDISRNALNKPNRELIDGIIPFQMNGARPFQPAYLSGFMAEKRNIEAAEFQRDVEQEIFKATDSSLRGTVTGYSTVTASTRINRLQTNWKYTLLPAWVLTYGIHDGKVNYYALNGQTGKVRGVLPVSIGKLLLVSGLIAAAVFGLLALWGWYFT